MPGVPGQFGIIGHKLFNAVLSKFPLQEFDELPRCQGVQFDTPSFQEVNFLLGRAVLARRLGPLFPTAGRVFPESRSHRLDVGQPQTEIDDRDLIIEADSAGRFLASVPKMLNPDMSKSWAGRDTRRMCGDGPSGLHPGSRYAHALGRHDGEVEPLGDQRMGEGSALNPFFSMNRSMRYRLTGPAVDASRSTANDAGRLGHQRVR